MPDTFDCMCGSFPHRLRVTRDDDPDYPPIVTIELGHWPRRLRERIRGAWHVLFGRDVGYADICIDNLDAHHLAGAIVGYNLVSPQLVVGLHRELDDANRRLDLARETAMRIKARLRQERALLAQGVTDGDDLGEHVQAIDDGLHWIGRGCETPVVDTDAEEVST